MTHTPVVTDTIIEYYDFQMNGMEGPQIYLAISCTFFCKILKARLEATQRQRFICVGIN